MRKLFFLAFASLLLNTVQAQGIKLGVKVGANLTDVSGVSFKDGFKYGYHAGFFSELMLTKKFGIQPEVLFSETNLRAGDSLGSLYNGIAITDIAKIKLQYISIPILLDYKPIPFLTLQAGPQFGILMNQTKPLSANAKDTFKKGDLSLLLGAQLNVFKFRVYARYAVGLSDINDFDNKEKWNSQTVQLGLGLAL
jgi:hypothetical protein